MSYRHDAEFLMVRDQAETKPCGECHQPIGETCLNLSSGEPLGKLPAHAKRIAAADVPEGTP